MVVFTEVFNIFKDKDCELLISEEEFNKDKHSTNDKYKYIASCGHENEVHLYIFKIRGTGIICPKCVNINTSNKIKEKSKVNPINTYDIEYESIKHFQELTSDVFDVKIMREGCLSNIGLKPKNIEDDLWIMIQIKSTSKPGRQYGFKCINKYLNCVILCICYSDKRIWAFDGNNIKGTISIGLHKSKYSEFEIKNDKIQEKLTEFYNTFPKFNFDTINTPISIYQQLEYEYCKFRESKIPLEFIYNDKHGLVYDFTVNGYKVQEKIGTYRKNRKNTIMFSFHKNNGTEDGLRKFISYKKGDADFYWLNIPNKKQFYIIPEDILIEKKYINSDIKKSINIIPTYKKYEWLKEYLFDYEELDLIKLKVIFKIE